MRETIFPAFYPGCGARYGHNCAADAALLGAALAFDCSGVRVETASPFTAQVRAAEGKDGCGRRNGRGP